MSGVAGVLRLGGVDVDPQELLPVLSVLQRRGPDGTGHVSEGPVVLGCARLDTLPEDGHQPVRCGRVIAVADARLDNRDELCRDLGLPHEASDTVLIAAAIAKWGATAPERLEGDFAVIGWNGDKLFVFRDRFGVKPLFYANIAGRLLVASEITALIAHQSMPADFDKHYFFEYLAARKPPTARTPYQAITRLMPGECMIAGETSTSTRSYYQLRIQTANAPCDEVAERTRYLLDEAVATSLRSDGPIVCDVSGGMDSTSLYATARAVGRPLHARSIVSDRWPQIDERQYSRELVGDAPWIQIYAEEHPPLTDVSFVAARFDEPVQDILLGQLRPMLDGAGPKRCRVALSGHGGDALMAGGFDSIRDAIYGWHWWTAYREARQWADERDRSMLYVIRWALQRSYVVPSRLPWASSAVAKRARAEVRRVRRMLRRSNQGRSDSIDTFLLSLQAGLRQKPSSAMDTRYPFLYRPLVEYALATPNSLKTQGAMGKRVMRHAMRDRLPASILERIGKTPFDLLYAWGFQSQWQTVEALLGSSILIEWGFLNAAGVHRLLTEVRDGKTARLVEAMYLLAIEAWLQYRPSVHAETAQTSLSAAGRLTESRPTEVGRR
jgi:asparagine synthase (glutamine-hydrolysing)